MAYIKLTSKLRRMLEDLEQHMRRSGFKADTRWMEQNPSLCPLCGESGGRAGTISMVQAPATMAYIPYAVCEQCVSHHYDPRRGGFGAENIQKIEERIFGALEISNEDHYRHKVPERFRDFFDVALENALKDRLAFNPVWLQNRTYTCPGCGKENMEPAKAGISVAGNDAGPVVMIPYLVCGDCAHYTDTQLSALVMDRLLEAIGEPIERTKH